MNNFAVFILSHKRANNIPTIRTLKRCGYTGKIYIIIDNEDEQIDEYKKLYNDNLIIFNKTEFAKTIDVADNFKNNSAVVYARNKCWDIAKKLNIKYFLQLDDDYTGFFYRFVVGKILKAKKVKALDLIFESMLKFLQNTNSSMVAFLQGGDFVQGAKTFIKKQGLQRKVMNTFFCDVGKKINFPSRTNEDVTTYVYWGGVGYLFFSIRKVTVVQNLTQSNKGGLTDIYLEQGTYVKSFYSVLFNPSSVKINLMGTKYLRIHHKIIWDNAVPKIISENYKKT